MLAPVDKGGALGNTCGLHNVMMPQKGAKRRTVADWSTTTSGFRFIAGGNRQTVKPRNARGNDFAQAESYLLITAA
jgi:hypothetical protein